MERRPVPPGGTTARPEHGRRRVPTDLPAGGGLGSAAAHDLLAIQRAAGNRAAGQAVQRALSFALPADADGVRSRTGKDAPVATSRHSHTEALSGAADRGQESETGAFTHGNGSEHLEAQTLEWRGSKLGAFKAAGKIKGDKRKGNFTSLVKMHLVNSFLHHKANAWGENWVWGHADLNKEHNKEIEEPAKNLHPGTGAVIPGSMSTVFALSYRSEQNGRSTIGSATAADMTAEIQYRINQEGNLATTPVSAGDVDANVTIGGMTIPAFHAAWSGAVAATTASVVHADVRAYAENGTALEYHDEDLPDATDTSPIEFRAQVSQDADRLLRMGVFSLAGGDGDGPARKRRRGGDT